MSAARRTDGALLAACVLVPAAIAAMGAANVPEVARDGDVARILGRDGCAWRALDGVIALALGAFPVGTRAARAALGGALVAAIAGAALYGIARALVEACATTRRVGPAAACIATLLPLVGIPWQTEASSLGGSALGATLILLPLSLLAPAQRGEGVPAPPRPRSEDARRLETAVFALGLAAGYGPAVGGLAVAAVGLFVALDPRWRASVRDRAQRPVDALGLVFAGSLAFAILGLARARAAGGLDSRCVLGDASPAVGGAPLAEALTHLGGATALLSAGGVVLAALAPRARPLGLTLAAIAVAGVELGHAGVGAPPRFAPPLLAGLAAACALAGAALQAVVRLVAAARVPMARASAAMVLVLELVLPVDAADETLTRPRSTDAAPAWDDAAWGELPADTVVLLASRATLDRARAARARGALRGDVTFVAALPGPSARRDLASDPALLPLWRDLELAGSPTEASLADVASARPLVTAYEPSWGRAIGSHLVADGLLDRFELEPRGASDRRAALAVFVPRRERLARAVRGDAAASAAAADLLRARASLALALDPRDVEGLAALADDLRAVAPGDPLAAGLSAAAASRPAVRSQEGRR